MSRAALKEELTAEPAAALEEESTPAFEAAFRSALGSESGMAFGPASVAELCAVVETAFVELPTIGTEGARGSVSGAGRGLVSVAAISEAAISVAAIVEGLEGALADALAAGCSAGLITVFGAVLEATFSIGSEDICPASFGAGSSSAPGALIGTELDGPLESCGAPVS